MDDSLLQTLGLNEKEIRLYSAVLNVKQITPAALAKAVGIKRTTTYSMVRGLIEKGLLLEDNTRRPRVFRVAGRAEINIAINIEKRRSEERQSILAELGEKASQKVSEDTYPVPQIRFVEEEKISQFLNQRIVDWNKSMDEIDSVFWGYQDPTFLERYESWIGKYWEYAPKHFEVKLLTNLAPSEKKVSGKYDRRYTKFWGEATNFLSTTWVIGDYIVMINTRQHPFYLVEIHNKLMAHDQREVFKNLWPLI
jgi:DNA-binding MarR family transcriptional regulator